MDEQQVGEADVFGLVLGRVVAGLRDQQQMSQTELAEALGISQPVLSRIESGKTQPDAYLYGQIAEALGLDVQQLNQQVESAMARAREHAERETNEKGWAAVTAAVGIAGLIGLIVFVVAALLGGSKPGK